MSTPDFCPSCGYNFKADKVITLGDWHLHLTVVLRGGRKMPFTPQQAHMLHTLAKAYPNPVSSEVLLNRCSESAEDRNTVNVVILRIRRKLEAEFGQPAVENVRGKGYRLADVFYNQGLHTPT